MDFAIKDLLKGRRIGVYQDLALGGEQFLSRSRVHTPPGKGKQRIVHALYSLNEATVKRQTDYEDLCMFKSVVRPQDYMLNLDVESALFHVPIHPKHRKFFSSSDGLVKAFDVTFLMVRQLVGVVMLLCKPESPGLVTEWIVTGERVFSDGSRDLDCDILEEELS